MAALKDLIDQIQDIDLRQKINEEVYKLSKQKKFGLVFEDHMPECTPLHDISIEVGKKVALNNKKITDIYVVKNIKDNIAECINLVTKENRELKVKELTCIAEFGDSIYPYLRPIDVIENAPDSSLWHILIEADNYHALQLLRYLYAGKVDCIYIDPPYNTGAKDWKYNNDYVDSKDSYRHSKWLSMMEKRLKLAKQLLNPKDSVLIVTIDEKEYLHLGCLLEEIFSGSKIQMVTDVINPKGVARDFGFSRVEEYIFFVYIKDSKVVPNNQDMLNRTLDKPIEVRWASLQRSGSNSRRHESPTLFYPIFFNKKDHKFHSTGESLTLDKKRSDVTPPEGTYAIFPLGKKNDERTWQLSQETLKERMQKGYVKFGKYNPKTQKRSISYLSRGILKKIEDGKISVSGMDSEGAVILGKTNEIRPMSVWNQSSHSASENGSTLIQQILGDKRFTYPKSLYSTLDAIRFFTAKKPNALILDFFAGSGTTLHAINLLNSIDGGNRRCILVTNNEVSESEAKKLTNSGFKPGDIEWEKLGIAQHVTWPRTVCSIQGTDINGEPLQGSYLGSELEYSNGFESNVAYLKLGFLDKDSVALGRQFSELLPVLWMKTGCIGACPALIEKSLPSMLILSKNGFAVLIDEKQFSYFVDKVNTDINIQTVFIVTDSDTGYREMSLQLKVKTTYQLYKDYLDNFRINTGR
jgi:adenine specific DNA methylase mod